MAQLEDVFRFVEVFEVVDAEVMHLGGGDLGALLAGDQGEEDLAAA